MASALDVVKATRSLRAAYNLPPKVGRGCLQRCRLQRSLLISERLVSERSCFQSALAFTALSVSECLVSQRSWFQSAWFQKRLLSEVLKLK